MSDDVPWLSPEELRAWHGLQFMQMRLTAELAKQLALDSDLSYSDYLVLVALTREAQGRLRAWELVRDLGWEKSRVSHHVTRMVERGLVRKQACTTDRRGGFVVVTARGRRQIAAAAPGHVRAVRRLFLDHVTGEQLKAIATAAQNVLAAFASAPGSDGPRSGNRTPAVAGQGQG